MTNDGIIVMRTIKLRKETAGDDAFLRQIYASVRAEEMAFLPLPEEQKSAFLNMQYDLQRRHYLTAYPDADYSIILSEDIPIGRLYVNRGEQSFHLMDISLLPEYRGKGLGSYLLKNLLTEAEAARKPISLHVRSNNRAMRLYQGLGFEIIRDDGVYVLMERR